MANNYQDKNRFWFSIPAEQLTYSPDENVQKMLDKQAEKYDTETQDLRTIINQCMRDIERLQKEIDILHEKIAKLEMSSDTEA